MLAHDLREQMQAAVKKVFAAGNDDQRQLLRPRPVEYCGERHDFIVLAVDNQRVRRHGGRRGRDSGRRGRRAGVDEAREAN